MTGMVAAAAECAGTWADRFEVALSERNLLPRSGFRHERDRTPRRHSISMRRGCDCSAFREATDSAVQIRRHAQGFYLFWNRSGQRSCAVTNHVGHGRNVGVGTCRSATFAYSARKWLVWDCTLRCCEVSNSLRFLSAAAV